MKSNITQLNNNKSSRSSLQNITSKLVQKSMKVPVVARILGECRKTLSRNVKMNGKRKSRTDKLSMEDSTLVNNFYLEQSSRPMPNKRDVILIRDSNGEKKEHVQKHVMEMTHEKAYKLLKSSHPDIKIGKRKFDSLRPIQVRRASISSMIVYCCTYCENIRLKVQAFNRVWLSLPVTFWKKHLVKKLRPTSV
ncbi:hypothetical protein ACF0H5_009373 [Mactra antiquata]